MTRIRRRYLVLHGLRWLPSGLLIPVMVLLMLERGIGLSQIGLIFAIQGFVVLGLELPTGGLADALGRKPVLVAAAVFSLASLAMFAVAQTVWMFAVALLLQGIYRALESGPLDAWYVDAALAADPRADLEGGLSAAGVVTGVSIASGALLAGGLVALGPIGRRLGADRAGDRRRRAERGRPGRARLAARRGPAGAGRPRACASRCGRFRARSVPPSASCADPGSCSRSSAWRSSGASAW